MQNNIRTIARFRLLIVEYSINFSFLRALNLLWTLQLAQFATDIEPLVGLTSVILTHLSLLFNPFFETSEVDEGHAAFAQTHLEQRVAFGHFVA